MVSPVFFNIQKQYSLSCITLLAKLISYIWQWNQLRSLRSGLIELTVALQRAEL